MSAKNTPVLRLPLLKIDESLFLRLRKRLDELHQEALGDAARHNVHCGGELAKLHARRTQRLRIYDPESDDPPLKPLETGEGKLAVCVDDLPEELRSPIDAAFAALHGALEARKYYEREESRLKNWQCSSSFPSNAKKVRQLVSRGKLPGSVSDLLDMAQIVSTSEKSVEGIDAVIKDYYLGSSSPRRGG